MIKFILLIVIINLCLISGEVSLNRNSQETTEKPCVYPECVDQEDVKNSLTNELQKQYVLDHPEKINSFFNDNISFLIELDEYNKKRDGLANVSSPQNTSAEENANKTKLVMSCLPRTTTEVPQVERQYVLDHPETVNSFFNNNIDFLIELDEYYKKKKLDHFVRLRIAEENAKKAKFVMSCLPRTTTEVPQVEIVNATRLVNLLIPSPNITSRMTPAQCVAILFYGRHCQFSVVVAPHYNALARVFPDIKIIAVDAFKVHSFNAQFGIVGVPTVLFFHNGRAAIKYNESEYTLEMFSKFITTYTGLGSQGKLVVTSADFKGPVPSIMSNETDYYLALAWFFISLCGIYLFSKSSWWRLIKETILNTWRETEAHHEHSD